MKRFFSRRRGRALKCLVGIPLWIALIAAVIWLVMALWNWLMPALFMGARPIDYWQALGLVVLCKILFGHGPGRWGGRRRWERMTADMTPEEREQFKSRFGRRCGGPEDAA
jgi:hypothetical protein